MFVARKLIFLELQKTGGSHIIRLLERYTDGITEGKHNRLPVDYDRKYIVGSIRSPWDWYVSLWAYGVGGKGAVRARGTAGIDLNYYHRMLPKEIGKNWLTFRELFASLYHDALKPVELWQQAYKNSSDPELFRSWLRLLLDKKRRYDIGEGYGFSPISTSAGLLTYRYFRLFTVGNHVFSDKRLIDLDGIREFDREFNITSGIIRNESLEADFVRVLEEAGQPLSDDQINDIENRREVKTNISERKSASYYYDDETIALVAERDRYLIEKYSYTPPC